MKQQINRENKQTREKHSASASPTQIDLITQPNEGNYLHKYFIRQGFYMNSWTCL